MNKGLISQRSLESIKRNASLVAIVQNFTPLKPAGNRHVGLCPFHREKSPSFQVDEHQGLYYCFGCQKGGDLIGFVRDVLSLEFTDAIEWIASKTGVRLEYENTPTLDPLEPLKKINETAARWFQLQLKQNNEVLTYLQSRGLNKETIEAFRIGFAPESWDGVRKELERGKHKHEDGVKVGLLVPSQRNSPYDRFRNRIMIPVVDRRGQVVAFGGRVFESAQPKTSSPVSDAKTAKYINSPESPLFHKSDTFFGGPGWEQAALSRKKLILVEGYFDCIALWTHGFKNTVAVMGLGLTEKHIQWILSRQLEVILMLDGDEAGQRASQRILPIFLKHGLYARECALPQGEDPDTYAQKVGFAGLEKHIESSPLHFDSVTERLIRSGGKSTTEEIQTINKVLEIIDQISDPVARDLRLTNLAQRFSLTPQTLRDSRPAPKNEPSKTRPNPQRMTAQPSRASTSTPSSPIDHEKKLLELIAALPRRLGIPELKKNLDLIRNPKVRSALDELLELWSQGFESADSPIEEREQHFVSQLKEKWYDQPLRLKWLAQCRFQELAKPLEIVENKGFDQAFEDCMKTIKEKKMERDSNATLASMKNLNPERDWDQVKQLMEQQLERARARFSVKEP